MWRTDELAEIAAEALRGRVEELRLEQAVRGLDALAEVALHPLLRRGYERAGFGAYPERPYPGEAERRPRHAERERCDLVLTPDPSMRLIDPVADLIERDKAAGTLFDPELLDAIGRAGAADHGERGPGVCPPGEAFWLEIKTIGQHAYSGGIPGPNGAYASELLTGPAADAIKLEWDPAIRHCGVLIVLFTEDERTADHDLGVLMHRLLDRAIPVASPTVRKLDIPDVIGNGVCSVALVPLVKG